MAGARDRPYRRTQGDTSDRVKRFMTAEEGISLLRSRATTVRVRGIRIDCVIDRDEGPPGLFLPRLRDGKNRCLLRRGRDALKTFFTMCHELGHFWSYATARRTASYNRALLRWQNWENTVLLAARNAEAVLQYRSASAAPADVFEKALEDARRERPCPLEDDGKREICAEEARAWCFGFEIATRLSVTAPEIFVAEATAALAWYYERLQMPAVAWSPADCACEFSKEDRRYIDELTSPS